MLDAKIRQELVGLVSVKLVTRRELDVQLFFKGGDHIYTAEGRCKVEIQYRTFRTFGMVLDLVSAKEMVDHAGQELLSKVHKIVHISVSPVELAGGKFRVVSQIDAFVAELTTDFVHLFQTTNGQHLEIQFGCDTHEHVEVQIVVVSDEGLGSGTTSNHVHHGSFDFQETVVVEERAEVRDDLGASDELVADIVVHDKIKVSLAVTKFLILETIVSLGQHAQAGRKQLDGLGEDGKFTAVSLARNTTDTNNITTSKQIVDGTVILLGILSGSHDLDLDTIAVKIVEAQLGTRGTLVVDTAGNSDNFVFKTLTSLQMAVLLDEFRNRKFDVELVGVRVGALVFAACEDSLATQFKVLLQ